jgi:hypothetical protein
MTTDPLPTPVKDALEREHELESANRSERALWSRLYASLTGDSGEYSAEDLERVVGRVSALRAEHAESTRLYEQRLERLKSERDEALACFARSAREYAVERQAHEATKAELAISCRACEQWMADTSREAEAAVSYLASGDAARIEVERLKAELAKTIPLHFTTAIAREPAGGQT